MRNEIKVKIQSANDRQIDLGHLNINDDELNDITRDIVATWPNVQQIILSHNNITDVGAQVLMKTFTTLKNLTLLDLQFNQLTLKGAESIYHIKKTNNKLQIGLAGNLVVDASQLDNLEKASTLQKGLH